MIRRILGATLLAALAVGLVLGVGHAEVVRQDIVDRDAHGRSQTMTHRYAEGDSVWLRVTTYGVAVVDTATLADSLLGAIRETLDPTGYPAWFVVDFAEETTAKTAWFRFKEMDVTDIHGATTYTWGEWMPLFLNGEATPVGGVPFQVGLWDQCCVHVVGSADGGIEMAWRVELIKD